MLEFSVKTTPNRLNCQKRPRKLEFQENGAWFPEFRENVRTFFSPNVERRRFLDVFLPSSASVEWGVEI